MSMGILRNRFEPGQCDFGAQSFKTRLQRILLALILVLLLPSARGAGERPSAFDPQAVKLLRAMSDRFASARQITIEGRRTVDPAFTDEVELRETARVSVGYDRSGKLYQKLSMPGREVRWHYDGHMFSIFDSQAMAYGTLAVSGGLEAMADRVALALDFRPPMLELLAGDPYGELTRNADRVRYAGRQTVRGTPCHQLVFTQGRIRWDLWISVADLLPVKLAAVARHRLEQPTATIEFDQVNLKAQLAKEVFAFLPPAGAIRVEWAGADNQLRPNTTDQARGGD
jgi:hypothetical protein